MSAHEVLAALVPYLAPGEALTLPHNFAVALATERDGGPGRRAARGQCS